MSGEQALRQRGHARRGSPDETTGSDVLQFASEAATQSKAIGVQDRVHDLDNPLEVLVVPWGSLAPTGLAVPPESEATVASPVKHEAVIGGQYAALRGSIVERALGWNMCIS